MSISQLPQVPTASSSSSSSQTISASVTRILTLANFSPSLKTRDLQSLFTKFADDKGGFKIKWIDDVTALAVFADATVAKRAYLHILANPSTLLPHPATVRPYDGPDAQAIIHSVAARSQGHGVGSRASFNQGAGASMGGNGGGASQRESFSMLNGHGGHGRTSMSGGGGGVMGSFNVSPPPGLVNGSSAGPHGRASSVASGMFGVGSGSHQRMGSFGQTQSQAGIGGIGGASMNGGGNHARISTNGTNNSSSSNSSTSWGGRHSVSGVLSGFSFGGGQGGSSSSAPTNGNTHGGGGAMLPPLSTTRFSTLPTHQEGDSIATPTTAQTVTPHLSRNESDKYPPVFVRSASSASNRSTSSNSARGGGERYVESPNVEVLGTIPFAEGGPAGLVGEAGKRMIRAGIGANRQSMHGGAQGGDSGIDARMRRESDAAGGAEKALREVGRALEGLGVGTA